MGQKVNPIGLRVGINRTWDSRWFADSGYSQLLHEDLRIRDYLKEKLAQAGVSKVLIERPARARLGIRAASLLLPPLSTAHLAPLPCIIFVALVPDLVERAEIFVAVVEGVLAALLAALAIDVPLTNTADALGVLLMGRLLDVQRLPQRLDR